MIFSRVLSLLAFFLAVGVTASASTIDQVTVAKRQGPSTDVANVLNTLKASTDTILPQIGAIAASGNASRAGDLAPLIGQLTAAITTASKSMSDLGGNLSERQLGLPLTDIAALLAGIITAIVQTLSNIILTLAASIPTTLIPTVDLALTELVAAVELLLSGVLTLVAALLVDISGLLNPLGLTSLFGILFP